MRGLHAFADSWVSRTLATPDYPPFDETSLPPDLTDFLPLPGNQFPTPQLLVATARAAQAGGGPALIPSPSADVVPMPDVRMTNPKEHSNFRTAFTGNASVLSFNQDRAYLLLINDGAVDVRIAFGQEADASSGVLLQPTGSYELTDGTVSPVKAFSVGVGVLVVVEGFNYPRPAATKRRSVTDAEIAAMRREIAPGVPAPAPAPRPPPPKPYTWRTG